MTAYFDTLTERLRAHGLPAADIDGIVADLSAYTAESGADPEEEFGPVDDFARRLTPKEDNDGPEMETETWRWTADAFHERARLNEFGDQGWEVERVDAFGHFISHRDRARPQRWEYLRTTAGRDRPPAAEGWEHCGNWMIFDYYKRPKSAMLGPAGELPAPPTASSGRVFWSKRFYLWIGGYLVLLIVLLTGVLGPSGPTIAISLLVTVAVMVLWVIVGQRRARNREG
jgi:hypothetical protein